MIKIPASLLPCKRKDDTLYCNIRNKPCSYSPDAKSACEFYARWISFQAERKLYESSLLTLEQAV